MSKLPDRMRAAVLHTADADFQLEKVALPVLRPDEVLVKVEACNVVQNLKNVLKAAEDPQGDFTYPELPAILGLDVAGTVAACGPLAVGFEEGDRVYVNPGLSCGGCEACRTGRAIDCEAYALRAYFGIGRQSQKSLNDHPAGGFAEYIAVPQANLVRLQDDVDFDTAARFGYLGTAFRALKLAGCGPGKVVVINGATGTLGLGAVAIALALGAKQVLGIARDEDLFPKTEALGAKGRVQMLKSVEDRAPGTAIDIVIDAIGGGAPAEPFQQALYSLRRGGRFVNIGANSTEIAVDFFWAMSNNITITGSSWFTTADCQEMADLAGQGTLDLSYLEHRRFPLADINEAIAATDKRSGGFTNFSVVPSLQDAS